MGWCPGKGASSFGRLTPVSDLSYPAMPDGGAHVADDVIVDYRSTGIPIPLFIILVVGLAVIIQYLLTLYRPLTSMLVISLILIFIVTESYTNIKKTRIEVTRNTLTMYRPFFKPAVIPRDAIENTEVKENTSPLPLWATGIAFIVIFITSLGFIYGGLMQSDAVLVVFWTSIMLFFGVLFYRVYSRALYSHIVVITTATKKVAAVYTCNPEWLTQVLEA